ncbi:MAG: hypothetical protein MUQ00_07850 [Candidatus Aminicenantes bacterium]|nr:hypothetical protein [Candidatus Aminicenantes bacterium]
MRDLDRDSVEKNYARALGVIDGAAKMSGTTYKIRFISGVHEVLPSRAGAEAVYANLLLVGPPAFSAEEQAFAREIQKNLGVAEKGLKTGIEPFREPEKSWGSGSTAKVMAATGLDIIQDPKLLQKMRNEWLSKTKGKPYVSPLPPDLQPPVKK